jgi:NAD(P)-dependent dehydrogenase (short-subunit alcohol dehydrogenase family)
MVTGTARGPADPGLDGRVGLVTGAGTREGSSACYLGIGAASAIALAAAGARVAVVDVEPVAIERTLGLAGDLAGRLLPVVADVSDEDACSAAIERTAAELGALSILVNNVGTTGDGARVATSSLPGWNAVMAVNLTSVMLMCKHAIPVMTAVKGDGEAGGGSIVNVSSIGAIRGYGSTAYAASKGGMISLGTSMAYAYGRDGVRVNTILPGHVATPMGSADRRSQLLRNSANMLGVEGTAWNVADAVVFLASDAARWITAAALAVDAGASMATGLAMFGHMSEATAAGAAE